MRHNPGRVFVHTNERVLLHDENHGGVVFPAGSRVVENDHGALHYAWPVHDIVVDGITILAHSQLDPPRNGHLSQWWTMPGQKLHDLVITEGGVCVRMDEDGRLQWLALRRPTRLRGMLLQHHVMFHPAPGAPFARVVLAEATELDGEAVGPGPVQFDATGQPVPVREARGR